MALEHSLHRTISASIRVLQCMQSDPCVRHKRHVVSLSLQDGWNENVHDLHDASGIGVSPLLQW
jgi:hypothetical protein